MDLNKERSGRAVPPFYCWVVLLLAGVQMLFLYIIGAYLSKDYMENKKRPLYIVREER